MGSLTLVLRRADGSAEFDDIMLQTLAALVYRTNGMTVEAALEAGLPEERESVPASLSPGKIITVNGVVYVGNTGNVPVKLNYTHPTGSGNNHIPAGGITGQFLQNSGDGTGTWSDLPVADSDTAGIVTLSDAVDSANSDVAASSAAVKAAYDIGNHDHPYVPTTSVGAADGVVPLNSSGVIDSTYLPSYVDDVLDGTLTSETSFVLAGEEEPCVPESGKIYNDTTTNKSYRWSGTVYVSLNDGVALGETENTAYRGDRGKIAYEHSQTAHARVDATKTEVSSTNGNLKINDAEVTVYTHPSTSGNKHIPTAGTPNQYLKNVSDGTAEWASADTAPTEDSEALITSGAVHTAVTTLNAQIGTKADANHTHQDASTNASGFMSSAMVNKLNGIEDGANKTVVDSSLDQSSSNPVQNSAVYAALAGKSDATHSHATVTEDAAGFMSPEMLQKLDGISEGATNITVDDAISSTSTNPVQNRVIYEELGKKSNTEHTHDVASSTTNGFMSSTDFTKLSGIEDGANKTIIDAEINNSSENPVQNKAVHAALATKANASSLAGKQDVITGAASTVVSDNLGAGKAVITDSSGKIAESPITAAELAFVGGVTAGIQGQLNGKAPIDSPTFTGTPTAPTASSETNNTQLATTEFVQTLVNNLMEAKDALHFIGVLNAGDTLPAANAGHIYRVADDGLISTLEVHAGDTLTCCVDGTATDTPENWFVTHTNHDGQVMGPTSAADSHVAVFDGATGKLIKDSGFTIAKSVPADAVFTDTVYTHPNSGVTNGSYGSSTDVAPGFGGTIIVPYVTVDAQGHITAAVDRTITLPAKPTSVSGNAGTATKLQNARTIALTGDVTGSATFDGSADVSIAATVVNGGLNVQYSPTQPTDQKTGDQWFEPISAVNS